MSVAEEDIVAFQALINDVACRHVLVLSGAGVSAESGIPTFRGEGGLWRTHRAQDVATTTAFRNDPSQVWEFYHHRREVAARCRPNDGHFAIAAFQQKMRRAGKEVSIITQNIDALHQAAGAESVIDLHGTLWLLKKEGEPGFLVEEGKVWEDRSMPLAPCFEGRCQPDRLASEVPASELPRRDGQLVRPAVVWWDEDPDPRVMRQATDLLHECDLLLVAGTSGVAEPANEFPSLVASRGKPCVEVNPEATPVSKVCRLTFAAKTGELLPRLLDVQAEVQALKAATSVMP